MLRPQSQEMSESGFKLEKGRCAPEFTLFLFDCFTCTEKKKGVGLLLEIKNERGENPQVTRRLSL